MNETMTTDEKLFILKDIYQNIMPFNRLLGIEITSLTQKNVQVRIDMRDELIGNFVHGMLHGGVISAVLDLTGGILVSAELLNQLAGESDEEIARRMARIGTIDLRVDYLRAGKGDYFLSTGSVLRQGGRMSVVRTEMYNDSNSLIAAGTATYQVG